VSAPRVVLGALGVALAAYGGFLLLTRQDWSAVADTGVWLAAGVVLHDAVLTPLVLLTWAVLGRWLPPRYRGPAVVGLVVLGSLTLLSIPVLGRFGARPDNPTLLDRSYWAGWLLLAALTLVAVVAASLVRSRRR